MNKRALGFLDEMVDVVTRPATGIPFVPGPPPPTKQQERDALAAKAIARGAEPIDTMTAAGIRAVLTSKQTDGGPTLIRSAATGRWCEGAYRINPSDGKPVLQFVGEVD